MKPVVPAPQRAYGAIIYWLCIVAAVICTVGPVLAISFPRANVMDPHFLFYSIWKGGSPGEVWQEVADGFPGAHFWLDHLDTFDGLIQLGLVIGCSSAFFALVGTSVAVMRQRPVRMGWVVVSLLITAQIVLAAIGIWGA